MSTTLIWIAIACILGYMAHRQYGELLKVKRTHRPADEPTTRLSALTYMLNSAQHTVSLIDYRAGFDPSLYDSYDVTRLIEAAVERNRRLAVRVATTHRDACWMDEQSAKNAALTMARGMVKPSGRALTLIMDDGALAYVVNSWGRVTQYDCRLVGSTTRQMTLGAHLSDIENLFDADQAGEETYDVDAGGNVTLSNETAGGRRRTRPHRIGNRADDTLNADMSPGARRGRAQ